MDQEKVEKEEIVTKGRKRRFTRRLLLVLLLLPILLFLLFQIPYVQNKLADFATSQLSKKLGANVSVDKAYLNIWKGLTLNNFTVIGEEQDTILVLDELRVSLLNNLANYFQNNLDLNEITVKGTTIRTYKAKGDTANNLSLLIAKLSSPVKENQNDKSPLNLSLNQINLEDIIYEVIDMNSGSVERYELGSGNVVVDSINLAESYFDLVSVSLKKPIVYIIKGKENTQIIKDPSLSAEAALIDTIQQSSQRLQVESIHIENGQVFYTDERYDGPILPDAINFKKFSVSEIDVAIDSLDFIPGEYTHLDLSKLRFKDDKGFVLEELTSTDIHIENQAFRIPGFKLKTNQSRLQMSAEMIYNDWNSFSKFTEDVYLRADLSNSVVAIEDIIHFVPSLVNESFFAQNRTRVFNIRGRLRGPFNNLNGTNINLSDGSALNFKGNFGAVNLLDRNNAFVNLKVEELKSSVEYLRNLIPGFNPPQNFNKIAEFDFKGRFDGYFEDFVAFGLLQSKIGTADLDMRLDVKNGSENAKYSGQLRLLDFDLGKWSDNSDFGKVNFIAEVKDGQGLTQESAYADLVANIEKITIKDYEYKNVQLDGTLEENSFNGSFSVKDENIDFSFVGDIARKDSSIQINLEADIAKLDLTSLNLSDKISNISGKFTTNFEGNNLSDIVGVAKAKQVTILTDTLYTLDSVKVQSYYVEGDGNRIDFTSDIARGKIEGKYRLDQVLPQLKQSIRKNYPYHTRSWENSEKDFKINDFKIDLEIFDTKNILQLVGINDLRIRDLQAKGSIDSERESLNFDINAGAIEYKSNAFYSSDIILGNRDQYGFLVLNVDSTVINNNAYNPLYLEADLNADSIGFSLAVEEPVDSVDAVSLEGSLIPHTNGYKINIKDKDLSMLGSEWKIYTDNAVVIGNDFIDIRDLVISDGYREIEIKDIDNTGINVALKRFDFKIVNGIIDYDKIDFTGQGDIVLKVGDIINGQTYIQANLFIDDFRLNEESYGKLEVSFDKEYDDSYKVLLSIDKGNQTVKANLDYNSETNQVDGLVRGRDFPLDIFEFIIEDGISETTGTGNVDARIYGSMDDLQIDGSAYLNKCGVKIDYLGTSFFMDGQQLKLSENYIDLSNAILIDEEGNEGVIQGGLRHDLFRDFRMGLSMSAENAVIINTNKNENPLYYGIGKGQVNVNFSGSFDATNIDVIATTKQGTELNIPVAYTEVNYEESFITFVNKEDLLTPKDKFDPEEFKIEGLNIKMDLTMTDEADVNIIFNERLGDVIKGNGRGNLQIVVKRTGEFEINGEYEVEEGEYLFTARNLVAKSFDVRRGGKIKWTGDPLNASLDIKADYLVRTPLNIFLQEFLIDPSSEAYREASNAQNVNLILEMEGTLFAPEVNFDLEFPDLVGELNSFTQSKMRTLQTNEIALNSQVFGLLVSGQFLPDNNLLTSNLFGSGELVQTGISTIGEFISSQLSRIFTGLLQEALSENGLIAGVDFEIGLRNNTGFFANSEGVTSDIYPDEITLNLRNRFRFLDERLSLGGGFNYVRESPLQGINDYYIPNFVVEYFLTDDRQLKLRFYYRRDIDELSLNARRDRLGLGIGFRKEFGSLSEAVQELSNSVQRSGDAGGK